MRRNVILGGLSAVVLIAVAGWFFFLRDDAPPPVSLDEAVQAVTGEPTTTSAAPATTDAGASTPASGSPVDTTVAPASGGDGLDGTWTLDRDASFVGYRVAEELASVGFTEAVGRTSEVEATLDFAGGTVESLNVTVDMASVSTGNQFRDGQMRTQALETDEFPTASFALTAPIELGGAPQEGESFSAIATGDLTIHGVTNPVTIDIEGQLVGGSVVVIGSTEVIFADYDIDEPQAARVLSVEDRGVVEFSLAFVKA